MKRFIGLLASVLLLAASMVTTNTAAASAQIIPATNGAAIANHYIVVLKEGANPRSVAAIAGVTPRHVYAAVLNGFAAELSAGQLNALQRNPSVDYIEQDGEVTINTTQTVGTGQWGLDRIDQRVLPLNGIYNYTATGAGVTAYIISTGIYAAHSDFGGRAANVYDAFGGTGADCHGYGTHNAGIVGGTVYGVAKSVRLRGVRVFDCNGSGTFSGIIAAMDWVRLNAVKPAVAVMTGGGGASSSVDTAATNLVNSGVFFAVPAGDSNSNACNYSPARVANAMTVAASDRNDNRASFSNYGSCVDLYAPGVSITSDWVGGGTNTLSGTSISAAHVAGCAAKYLSSNPGATPTTVSNWIISNATTGVIMGNPVGTPNRLLYCPF